MRKNRVPQNSADYSHYRLLADLQAVYEKIVPKNSASFPQRSRDHIRRLGVHLNSAAARIDSNATSLNADWTSQTSRSPSTGDSIQEIVITPLHMHDRRLTSAVSPASNRNDSELNIISVPNGRSFALPKTIPSSPRSNPHCVRNSVETPSVYSEQSLRFVHGQVAVEQARALKSSKGLSHRLERKYVVAGSRAPIKSRTAFEDHIRNMVTIENRKATADSIHHNSLVNLIKPEPVICPSTDKLESLDPTIEENPDGSLGIAVNIRPAMESSYAKTRSARPNSSLVPYRKQLRRHSASSVLPLKKMDFSHLSFT